MAYSDSVIPEALNLTQQAQEQLEYALEKLNSAKNWGLFDTLGGGFISGLVKHSRMNSADDCVRSAQSLLRQVSRLLDDSGIDDLIDGNVGDVLRFADLFWDGLISDLMVQSRIRRQQDSIRDLLCKVRRLEQKLRAL